MTRVTRLAVIAFAFALFSPGTALSQTGPATLHVVGHGRVFVKPDMATVTITVDRSAATRPLAGHRVNAVTDRIIAGLLGIGVDRPSIQTSAISLNTQRIPIGHHRHRTAYRAEIDLTVTITRIALLSPLFAVASRDGATSFSGPDFGFSDPSAGLLDATAAALRDARRRADAAAAQLGMHVVGVQSVDLDPGSGSTPLPSSGASGSAPATTKTPVLPGREEVDADVSVVYELGS